MACFFAMKSKNKFQSIITWIVEIWEEVEVQIYGITVAISFFALIYLFFHPAWMRPLIEVFSQH